MITILKRDEDRRGEQLLAYKYCDRHDETGWELTRSGNFHVVLGGYEAYWHHAPNILKTDFGEFKLGFCKGNKLTDIHQNHSSKKHTFRPHRKNLQKILSVLNDFFSFFEGNKVVVINSLRPETYFSEEALFLHEMIENYTSSRFCWKLSKEDFSETALKSNDHQKTTIDLLKALGESSRQAQRGTVFDYSFAKSHFKNEMHWNKFNVALAKRFRGLLRNPLSPEIVYSRKWERKFINFLHSYVVRHNQNFCYPD